MRFGWSAATGAGEADPGEFIGLVISPDCGFAAVTTDAAPRCPLTILKRACRTRFGRYRRPPVTGIHPAGKKSAVTPNRSEEHTSELQSLMRISYAVFCLKKKTTKQKHNF